MLYSAAMDWEYCVTKADEGERIDRLIALKTGITRSQAQKILHGGGASVAGVTIKPNHKARAGELIQVRIPEAPDDGTLVPEKIPLEILYEDEHLVFVNKPAGLVMYPAAGHASGTLLNALRYRLGPLTATGGPLRPGVVHRLDRDTSGVLVVARTDEAYHHLQAQFKDRTIHRRYLTIVYGALRDEEGVIEAAVGRSDSDRKRMTTRTRRGKHAITRWKRIESFNGATFLEVRLGTGRTHQIRVHFSSIGHPVLGDPVYGRKTQIGRIAFARPMLHAATLGLIHPATGEYVEFSVPLPSDMEEALTKLRQGQSASGVPDSASSPPVRSRL